MSDTLTRRTLLGTGVTAVLGGLAGCITTSREAEETVTETVAVDGVSSLVVDGDAGDVTVTAESRDDVRVEATKRAAGEEGLDRVDVQVGREGDTVSVTTDREEEENGLFQLSPSPLANVAVAVPEGFRVAEVIADTGDVTVERATGPLRVETDTGDIEAVSVEGDLTTLSDTGDQRIDGVAGRLSATADTGDVTATGASRLGDVETDTGDIEVSATRVGGNASVSADTGDVSLSFAEPLDAGVVVSTETGDIVVETLGDIGRIETESTFEATVAEGTNSLSVSTDTGDVEIAGGS
ncbi:DUF4097 family beta strand repeat-containing protein [Halostella salina]|uniref:DUF4097 family beta strand repeat-containing protein n=1 Tax=Halostella salina TaxID=1547897 RepID=UPI000EF76A34|nr:DUF4097 family beta strand repeat-containing protein [Halostella salina]